MTWPFDDVVPGPCLDRQAPGPRGPGFGMVQRPQPRFAPPVQRGGGVCFANDGPAGSGLEGRIRAVLVRGFSHEPRPGEDGRITVHIRSLRAGASHRASPVDQVQYQAARGATIYDVRAAFTTCTDYNRRVVVTDRERNFVCFTKASGVFDCSMTANSPGLAQDSSREIRK